MYLRLHVSIALPAAVCHCARRGLFLFLFRAVALIGGLHARARSFPQKNNKLVWDETVKILDDLFENVWGGKDLVEIDNITDLTVPVCIHPSLDWFRVPILTELVRPILHAQITLMVISVAGFGRRAMWKEDAQAPPGHQLTFTVSLLSKPPLTKIRSLTRLSFPCAL